MMTGSLCACMLYIYEKQDRLQQSRVPRSIGFAVASLSLLAHFTWPRASLVAQLVKNLSAMWETWVLSLGLEDPLEKGKTTHSNILVWRIPWTV